MTIVTRFAPSPTGFLHIGGARTALFNWLYSRRHRRHVPAADRGYRPAAFHPRGDRRHHRRAEMARARLGRRDCLSVRARGTACGGGQAVARARAAPITAMPRPRNWTKCARRSARRESPSAMTGAGATGRPRIAGRTCRLSCASRRRNRARRSFTTRFRATCAFRTTCWTISSCCAPTAIRPTCFRSWSTISTWASRTSSAATII